MRPVSNSPGTAAASPDRSGEASATLIVAIHGVLRLDPWVSGAFLDDTLDEDAYSLVVKRTVAYGLGSFTRLSPPSAQWAHNDAGGDWTQDGSVRQLAWLQVTLASSNDQRLPIQPAARVLDDVLSRVGQYEFAGVHTVVPMDVASDAREALAYASGWFAIADPAAPRAFTVTLHADPGLQLTQSEPHILASARDAAHDVMSIERCGPAPQLPLGGREPLAGELLTTGMVDSATYRCIAREWTLDIATWVTEVFIEALRAIGVDAPCLITVSTA